MNLKVMKNKIRTLKNYLLVKDNEKFYKYVKIYLYQM